MLRLTIVLGAVLYASVAIIDTSADVYEPAKKMYLRVIQDELLKIAKSLLDESSIPDEISSKLNDEISTERSHAEVALQELRSDKKSFEVIHPNGNISNCIQLYNQAAHTVRSILRNTLACTLKRLQMYYITDVYNDIIRDIELCKEHVANRHYPLLVNRCYRNTKIKVISSLRTSDETKLKMVKPSELQVQWSLDYCKDAMKFSEIKSRILTVTDNAKECINHARRNDTLADRMGSFIFNINYILCYGLSIISYC